MKTRPLVKTTINDIVVSTVVLDHEHLYVHPYETMIFYGGTALLDDYQERAATEEEAMKNHMDAISLVFKGE